MLGRCHGRAKRIVLPEPIKPFSWCFGLVTHSLEPATRPPDEIGMDAIQRQTQLRLLRVAVVADQAAWIVDLG